MKETHRFHPERKHDDITAATRGTKRARLPEQSLEESTAGQSIDRRHTEELEDLRARYVARAVAVQPIFARSAHNARLIASDGKEYIDFAGGIGALNLGHTPSAVVEAIKRQADALLHSNFL